MELQRLLLQMDQTERSLHQICLDPLQMDYQFTHITSSPHHSQANGEAERAVRTIKDLWKKDSDDNRALLAYSATPLEHGFLPTQLLMDRNLHTSLAQPTVKLDPKWSDLKAFRMTYEEERQRQAAHYNRRHC